MRCDLVLLSLGGVQRFIAESRSTADVAGASATVRRLVRTAAEAAGRLLTDAPAPCGLVFPTSTENPSVTNKIAFLAPDGDGPRIACAAAAAVGKAWRDQLAVTFTERPGPRPETPGPETPGVPDLSWVCVTGPVSDGQYGALWETAQREMAGRRRARVFEPFERGVGQLCAQSPGLPAVPAPPGVPRHERREALCAAGWVKRRAASERFPSTVSIASSAYRRRLLAGADADPEVAAALRGPVRTLVAALDELGLHSDRSTLRSVPVPHGLDALAGRLGAWVSPQHWDVDAIARDYGRRPDEATVRQARRAASALAGIARAAGAGAVPSPYFAVVVVDLDRLGRALGTLDFAEQRAVSDQLGALARRQSQLLEHEHPLAVPVYAGGDDLVAFCPATAALALVMAIRDQLRTSLGRAGSGPLASAGPGGAAITASAAVVFTHASAPLQDALRSAQRAVSEDAKSAKGADGRSRDALAVVVRRRGGQRARTVLPWWPRAAADGASAVDLLTRIRPGPDAQALSAGLASDLERDGVRLAELATAVDRDLLRAELIRLVRRHGGTREAGDALCTLGLVERGVDKPGFAPVPAALVARFLSQEAR